MTVSELKIFMKYFNNLEPTFIFHETEGLINYNVKALRFKLNKNT
jgi:hypothetical protein